MPNIFNNRREFFGQAGLSVGSAALASMLADEQAVAAPDFEPKAKAVIFLFMAGGPSQLELFEDKPKLSELSGQTPPELRPPHRSAGLLRRGATAAPARSGRASERRSQTTVTSMGRVKLSTGAGTP